MVIKNQSKTRTIKVSDENYGILSDIRLRLSRLYVIEMGALGIDHLVMDDAVTTALQQAVSTRLVDPTRFESNSRILRIETEYKKNISQHMEA